MSSNTVRTLRLLCLSSLGALCLAACDRSGSETPAAPAEPAPVAEAAPAAPVAPAEVAPAAPAEFDPASVPESTATLPPFPFFGIPEGLESTFDEKDKKVPFDRHYFIASNKAVAVEGKIFHDRFNLTIGPRTYSDLEFRRNYENAIAALGGTKINDTQYTL
jgi:OmpA-OmpF porin, OOP family